MTEARWLAHVDASSPRVVWRAAANMSRRPSRTRRTGGEQNRMFDHGLTN